MERRRNIWKTQILLCLIGMVINISFSYIANLLHFKIYLDSIGTILVASLGGYLPGITVGLVTNFIKSLFDSTAIYYTSINVFIAVFAAFIADKKLYDKIYGFYVEIFGLGLIGGGLGTIFTWLLFGFGGDYITSGLAGVFYATGHFSKFASELSSGILIDLLDKAISVIAVYIIFFILPDKLKKSLWVRGWKQAPLSEEELSQTGVKVKRISLYKKIVIFVSISMFFVAALATIISTNIYQKTCIDDHIEIGERVTDSVSDIIDPEKIDEYIEKGPKLDEYNHIKQRMYEVRETTAKVEYLYVYQIKEDGCHVVFDLDTDDVAGALPGDVVPFDKSFSPYIKDLLDGNEIEPIITNDTFGWLLTIYKPLYNKAGKCVCYVATDISMQHLMSITIRFCAKIISLFLGFFILILTLAIWFIKYNVIYPINTMSKAATDSIKDGYDKEKSIDIIKRIQIDTGDEIENLYHSLENFISDCVEYISEINEKNKKMEQMQDALIYILADVVESRDKCTGDHIKNTSNYVRLIVNQMKEEGIYGEYLTDKYMENVVKSAPLHDVGKIKISDVILNKPARLTDDEFGIMKTHTEEGNEIIERAIEMIPDPDFLQETKNMAEYHHEKWDGSGYPCGLKGEEIPLSARIMAVADVFDALVSTRSYKKGFSFEKAVEMIQEGAGTHFDPLIVEAFLDCLDKIKEFLEHK